MESEHEILIFYTHTHTAPSKKNVWNMMIFSLRNIINILPGKKTTKSGTIVSS